MTVYVDDAFIPYARTKICRLLSADHFALHRVAEAGGLARRFFQGDHYDVPSSKRAQVVEAGAVEISKGDMTIMLSVYRLEGRVPHILEVPLIRARRLRNARLAAEAREAWKGMVL